MVSRRIFRIAVADPDLNYIKTFRHHCNKEASVELVGTAHSADELLSLCNQAELDIVLFEPAMPRYDCFRLLRELLVLHSDLKLIACSLYTHHSLVDGFFDLGLHAFIYKGRFEYELGKAVQMIQNGQKFRTAIGDKDSKDIPETLFTYGFRLNRMEREILTLMSRGYSDKDIADSFILPKENIHLHRQNIKEKLQLQSEERLIQTAKLLGLT